MSIAYLTFLYVQCKCIFSFPKLKLSYCVHNQYILCKLWDLILLCVRKENLLVFSCSSVLQCWIWQRGQFGVIFLLVMMREWMQYDDACRWSSVACWNGYNVLPCLLALIEHGCLHIMALLMVYYIWRSLWIFNGAKCVLGTLRCVTYRKSIKYKSGGIIQLYSLASWWFLWCGLPFFSSEILLSIKQLCDLMGVEKCNKTVWLYYYE